MAIPIRSERDSDWEPIRVVHRLAFGRDDESRLVDALRDGGYTRVSLVAEIDGQVVGHVLFSELSIITAAGPLGALALAPLAVLPAWQRRGVGSELMRRGLDECRLQGHEIVIVQGHPAYYPRFGFSAELARPLESPYAGDAFMALELVAGALAGITGKVVYAPPFGGF
jgi:putative acetyltransferase